MHTKGGARKGSGRKRTSINESRAITLRKRGMSYREIAKAFQVPTTVISYFFTHIYKGEKL